jgi:hypothetical protein
VLTAMFQSDDVKYLGLAPSWQKTNLAQTHFQ